jgi:hypothetical protein
MSTDPTVRFEGSVNPESAGAYTLAIAAIYNGFVNGVSANEPRIIINGLVGNNSAFHSVNFQTLQAANLFMLAGEISTMGVNTVDMQAYSSNALTVTLNPLNNIATFRSTRPNYINFDLTMVGGEFNMSSEPGVIRVIIDGLTNLRGAGIGLAPLGYPIQEASAAAELAATLAAKAAAAASGGGNLDVTAKFKQQVLIERDLEPSRVSVLMDELVRGEEKSKKSTNCPEQANVAECI